MRFYRKNCFSSKKMIFQGIISLGVLESIEREQQKMARRKKGGGVIALEDVLILTLLRRNSDF